MNNTNSSQKDYQYRGCFYHKKNNSVFKYPVNLSDYQLNQSSQQSETPILKYRGVTHEPTQIKYKVDFSFSVYVQKYRGVDYLTCMTNLNNII